MSNSHKAATLSTTRAAAVRAALKARTAQEAAQVNDLIALVVGARYERFIGDTTNNLGPLTTPGSYDQKALEPLTNMHDAILERFARERFAGDLSAVTYLTPHEAAKALLGHLSRAQKADLAWIEVYESDPPARQTKRVTITYRDRGCGIAPYYVAESIFRIGSRHKQTSLWQQGAFGMGATTCYPNADSVVLVTRRPPELIPAGESDMITLAVAQWQQHPKGRGIYYLVSEPLDPEALPLQLPASEVPEFDPGTYLALVSYATEGFHTGRNDRTSLEFIINTRLWRPPLPVTLMNHVARGDHPKIHDGRGRQFQDRPRADRREFSDAMPFRISGRTYDLPVEVHYFEAGPTGDVGGMRNFVAQGHSVLLLANGQAHKHWDPSELRRRADRLTKLYDRILVVIDLDQIPVHLRTTRLFTPDRVELVPTSDAARLQDSIAAMLNSWGELRDLNNELVRKAIQSRGEARSTLQIAEKIRAHLAFRGGVAFVGGKREGDDPPQRPKWASADLWPDPTTLEGPISISASPGKTKFLYYFINATDEFLSSGRGRLELSCDHPRIGGAELVPGNALHRGMVRASLLVPDDVEVGTKATITATLRDWVKASGGLGGDHEWKSELQVVDPARTLTTAARKRRKTKTASEGVQVAVLWRGNNDYDDWTGAVPGQVDMIEAHVLAAEREEYKSLASLGSQHVPTVVLNTDYAPLKRYESERAKTKSEATLNEARDRYAVGVGVGLLVLKERDVRIQKQGKKPPDDTLLERQAIARSTLALMPDFDKLIHEAGLES
jgi:hypothetical protein